MSLAVWKAKVGDAAFVDKVAQLVNHLLDKPEPAPVSRAIAALEALRKASAAGVSPRAQAARLAMLDTVIGALEVLVVSDPDGTAAYIDATVARLNALGAARVAGRSAEAAADAQVLAEELADLPEEAFAALADAEPPPEGLAGLLPLLPPAPRQALAAALAAPMGRAVSYGVDVCAAVLADAAYAATDPAAVLAPDGVPSLVLAAMAEAAEDYAGAVAAAIPADAAASLDGVAAAVYAQAVPAVVSRPLLVLYGVMAGRFGGDIGFAAAHGHLLLRVIGPVLPEEQRTLVASLLDSGPAADQASAAAMLAAFTGHVLAAGRLAEEIALDGGDPDDLIAQRGAALQTADHLAVVFQRPTPPDPLGTLPANPISVLGQAILRARAGRQDGYDWAAVTALERDDPLMFLALLHDARMAVMDLIDIPGGLDAAEDAARAA